MRSPVFIFGFPRSGTTLLRAVLSQHSRISLVNEPELIWALLRAGYRLEDEVSPEALSTLIRNLERIEMCRRHLGRVPEARAALARTPRPISVREVYERLLPSPDDPQIVWGEKSLNNLFWVREIAALYPSALLIHIVRDPRAVALSRHRKRHPAGLGESADTAPARPATLWSFAQHARLWRGWMTIARASAAALPAQGWLELRYEDLLARPEVMLRAICDAIGVPYESEMLDAERRRGDSVLRSEAAAAHARLAGELDAGRAASFRALPPALLWIVERESGPLLRAFGYEPSHPALSLRERLYLEGLRALNRRWRRRLERSHFAERGVRALPT